MTKPFNSRELLARVKAVLRRARAANGGATATLGREVQMGKCRLNLDSRKIEVDPAKPDCLKTVRGAGYVYNPDCRTG